jgi:hypothetical protein
MPGRPIATALAVLGALAAVLAVPTAAAPPKRTLDRTILPRSGGGFELLRTGKGEGYTVRRAPGVRASRTRRHARRSLVYFGQLTDSQIVDETSPIRVDFLDQTGGQIKDAWRPQDAFSTQIFDQTIRAMNAAGQSRVRDARNRRAEMDLIIATGDLADNQQLNEVRWFRQVVDGERVDPSSGRPVSASNRSSAGASAGTATSGP